MTRALAWTKIRHGYYRSSAGHLVELLGGLWLLIRVAGPWARYETLKAAKRAAEGDGR